MLGPRGIPAPVEAGPLGDMDLAPTPTTPATPVGLFERIDSGDTIRCRKSSDSFTPALTCARSLAPCSSLGGRVGGRLFGGWLANDWTGPLDPCARPPMGETTLRRLSSVSEPVGGDMALCGPAGGP